MAKTKANYGPVPAWSDPMMDGPVTLENQMAQGASLEEGISGRVEIRTNMDQEEATRSICVMPKRER